MSLHFRTNKMGIAEGYR